MLRAEAVEMVEISLLRDRLFTPMITALVAPPLGSAALTNRTPNGVKFKTHPRDSSRVLQLTIGDWILIWHDPLAAGAALESLLQPISSSDPDDTTTIFHLLVGTSNGAFHRTVRYVTIDRTRQHLCRC